LACSKAGAMIVVRMLSGRFGRPVRVAKTGWSCAYGALGGVAASSARSAGTIRRRAHAGVGLRDLARDDDPLVGEVDVRAAQPAQLGHPHAGHDQGGQVACRATSLRLRGPRSWFQTSPRRILPTRTSLTRSSLAQRDRRVVALADVARLGSGHAARGP